METWLGAGVVAVTIAIFARQWLPGFGRRRRRTQVMTPAARRGVMALLSVAAAVFALPALVPALRRGFFAFCAVCPIAAPAAVEGVGQGAFVQALLLASWYYAATVLPVFVLASLLSGLLYARSHRFQVRGVLASFGLAALLPVCSCGVIPLGKVMIDRGEGGARDGLVFIATAPLLSPVIVALAFTVLGPGYAVVRVLGSLVVALAVALVVRPFLAMGRDRPPACASEDAPAIEMGCPSSAGGGGSVLLAGWGILTSLIRYVLYGVVLGSIITAALPPEYVGALLQAGPISLAATVVVGVPINMCAGEEILLAAPLVGMGFTLGHAIAFSLASTGICVSSIPLLVAVLGRRATLVMVGLYLVVPFLIGLTLDVLPLGLRFGPEPF